MVYHGDITDSASLKQLIADGTNDDGYTELSELPELKWTLKAKMGKGKTIKAEKIGGTKSGGGGGSGGGSESARERWKREAEEKKGNGNANAGKKSKMSAETTKEAEEKAKLEREKRARDK